MTTEGDINEGQPVENEVEEEGDGEKHKILRRQLTASLLVPSSSTTADGNEGGGKEGGGGPPPPPTPSASSLPNDIIILPNLMISDDDDVPPLDILHKNGKQEEALKKTSSSSSYDGEGGNNNPNNTIIKENTSSSIITNSGDQGDGNCMVESSEMIPDSAISGTTLGLPNNILKEKYQSYSPTTSSGSQMPLQTIQSELPGDGADGDSLLIRQITTTATSSLPGLHEDENYSDYDQDIFLHSGPLFAFVWCLFVVAIGVCIGLVNILFHECLKMVEHSVVALAELLFDPTSNQGMNVFGYHTFRAISVLTSSVLVGWITGYHVQECSGGGIY